MGGKISRNMILARLAELAFGGSGDAAKLAFLSAGDIAALDGLDLRALTGIHTSGNGGVEVRLLDRTKLIELLLAATEERTAGARSGAERLAEAIERSADRLAAAETEDGRDP